MEQREGESEHPLEPLLQSVNSGALFIRHLLVDLESEQDQFKQLRMLRSVRHSRQRKIPVLSRH